MTFPIYSTHACLLTCIPTHTMHTYMKTPTCVTFFTFTCTCIQTYVCTCTSSPIHEKMQGWHHQKKNQHSFLFFPRNQRPHRFRHPRTRRISSGWGASVLNFDSNERVTHNTARVGSVRQEKERTRDFAQQGIQ